MKKVVVGSSILLWVSAYQIRAQKEVAPTKEDGKEQVKEQRKKRLHQRKAFWFFPSVGVVSLAYLALIKPKKKPIKHFLTPEHQVKNTEKSTFSPQPVVFSRRENNLTYLQNSKKDKLSMAEKRLKERKKTAFPNEKLLAPSPKRKKIKKPSKIFVPPVTSSLAKVEVVEEQQKKKEEPGLPVKPKKNGISSLLKRRILEVRKEKHLTYTGDLLEDDDSYEESREDSLFKEIQEEQNENMLRMNKDKLGEEEKVEPNWQEDVLSQLKKQHHYNQTFKAQDFNSEVFD